MASHRHASAAQRGGRRDRTTLAPPGRKLDVVTVVLGAVLASALLRMLQGYDVTQLRKRVPSLHPSLPEQ